MREEGKNTTGGWYQFQSRNCCSGIDLFRDMWGEDRRRIKTSA